MLTLSVATRIAISAMNAQQQDGVPDRLAEEHDRRRCDGDADKGIESHGHWQAESLADDLRALRFRIAGEVGDIQGQGRPVADHAGQGGKEDGQELMPAMKFAGRGQHRAEAAGLDPDPDEQRGGHDEHERRSEALQESDGLDSAPDYGHVQEPEAEEAGPQRPIDLRD